MQSTVYESEALKEFTEEPVKSPKIEEVYGHLKFPKAPADRPYVYASFITTIDGKIAFQDAVRQRPSSDEQLSRQDRRQRPVFRLHAPAGRGRRGHLRRRNHEGGAEYDGSLIRCGFRAGKN